MTGAELEALLPDLARAAIDALEAGATGLERRMAVDALGLVADYWRDYVAELDGRG